MSTNLTPAIRDHYPEDVAHCYGCGRLNPEGLRLKPTPLGPELELRARVKESTPRKAIVEVTVAAAGEITARGEVVAVLMPESMGRKP